MMEERQASDELSTQIPKNANEATATFVPNEPSILLSDRAAIADFLKKELACPSIQSLYRYMHWVSVSNLGGSNIDGLHHYLVKGRSIVVTEDPELHLIWYKRVIWVKPLPRFLLDRAFWDMNLAESAAGNGSSSSRPDALGFMRTYAHLIRHESDFLLAQDYHLLPKGSISYLELRALLAPYRNVADEDVSQRYHYGQIRLAHLNWAVRLVQPPIRHKKGILGHLYYHPLYWDTADFIQDYIAPFFFIFATVSVILSTMQVVLAAETSRATLWDAFSRASWGFCIFVLVSILALSGVLAIIMAWSFTHRLLYRGWTPRKISE
jgi:hypothetical protein